MISSTDMRASLGSMSEGVEFFVDTIGRSRNVERCFIGHINFGGTISLGEVFAVAYAIPRTVEDVVLMRPLAAPINVRSVSLTLTRVEVMRQSVQALGQGITAIVEFAGEGLDLLCEGDRLNTCNYLGWGSG